MPSYISKSTKTMNSL